MTVYYFQLLTNGIIAGSIYAMFAVGLAMVYGVFKFINFSHGELITWGAYLSLMFFSPPFSLPLGFAVIPALVITVGMGLAQDFFVYRPLRNSNPIAILIASIGLSYLLRNGIRLCWGSDLRTFDLPLSQGLVFWGVYITKIQILMMVSALVFFGVLYFLLTRTLLGKSLRAVSDNMELSAIMGISMKKVTAAIWILAAVFAGTGGILLALDTNLEPMMGMTSLVKAFAAVLLGGAGNIWGALLGGLFIGIAENMGVAFISPDYKDFISFGVIILLLLFKPKGIFSIAGGVR
ncbi:branched-chain amino acid ABC transporter permease [Desulfospira joergensenii]|uniref:branched-chain amino acid ABC transporter permease n=1 Tax=Desulfospira joergensenii TaxID=53329 RepID=UPI0003B42575|nr:branched-chain amino acid ABC transporter permease [Desulfospira joergensenii]